MLENLLTIIERYNPSADVGVVIKAYNYAYAAHENQYRKSGEKYIVHPVDVAKILAELEMDSDTIAAGLMHDVLEDTPISYEQMKLDFNETIADLVDGVTKLGKINYQSKVESQAENLRKMFLAMGKDIRVIIIKLADRLHNMRTLNFMSPEKAKEKAQETLEIYAPIAHRLGISRIKTEMEDIALRYLDTEAYYELVEKVALKRKEREDYIRDVIDDLQFQLEESGFHPDIKGRAKHFYSIYKKMKDKGKMFEEIYDLMAVRIIVDSIRDCYGVLGVVHTKWKPLPRRFKDYIATPKQNLYQSLHTTVLGPDGEPLEIQIRTWEMHRVSEYGIAAHWKYKEGKSKAEQDKEMENKLSWLRQMMDWQKDVTDPTEFMESVKIDLYQNQVFVFTPQGEVIDLPAGSIPIDFAYKIHSDVGNHCVGAKVNAKMVPLDTELLNGDLVEIITSKQSNGPSRDWIKLVKSSTAKNKIRQWYKRERQEENLEKGRELLERETKKKGYPMSEFLKHKSLVAAGKAFDFNELDEFYRAVGYGGITINQAFTKLKDIYNSEHQIEASDEPVVHTPQPTSFKKRVNTSGATVVGVENLLIRFAKCCNPLPGDDIVGYITKGRGVSIHRRDCSNMDYDSEDVKKRLVEVHWDEASVRETSFDVEIQVEANDKKGLFMEVSKVFADAKLNVKNMNARTSVDQMAVINAVIEVANKKELETVISKLKGTQGVTSVFRVFN